MVLQFLGYATVKTPDLETTFTLNDFNHTTSHTWHKYLKSGQADYVPFCRQRGR